MRNSDGDYVATRYMGQTGTVLTGTGKTMEEARKVLKNQVFKYREGMSQGLHLVPTGEKITSPGYEYTQDKSGMVHFRYNPYRKVDVLSRPEISEYIHGGRKDNYQKETRQIRRAHTRGQ